MQRITLEINNSIYDYVMLFLENIPRDLVNIKEDIQKKIKKYMQHNQIIEKKLKIINPFKTMTD